MNVHTIKSVTICNPERKPYQGFKHGTTTFVSIPHDARSQVLVQWSEPCRVCITSSGQEIVCHPAANGHACIDVHPTLQAPRIRTPLPDLLRPLFRRQTVGQQRLYSFTVEIQADRAGYPSLATYDFHVMCPLDFEAARAIALEKQRNPRVAAGEDIPACAEGLRCPQCNQVRQTLEKL